jgi:glycosyltransferase involved in cell wall biosynthesis
MEVAVLMSTYNGENFLDKQLESLSCQTIGNQLKVYIRDDGSKDKTIEIIEKWKGKMSIILIKGINVGPAKSFYELLEDKNIVADYYAFCDQDDIWDSDKLECEISKLNKGFHLCLCNCRVINSDGQITQDALRIREQKISLPRLFVTGVAQGCAMVFTKELRDYILSKNISCVPMHDVILTLYALNFGKIYWEYEPKFSYRFHENNVVAKANKTKVQKIKTVINNWKNSSKNSMANVARELLVNCPEFDGYDKEFLLRMSKYKSSLANKLWLMKCEKISDLPPVILRSYKTRVLLGLL